MNLIVVPAFAAQVHRAVPCDALVSQASTEIVYRALLLESDEVAKTIALTGLDSPYLKNRKSAQLSPGVEEYPLRPTELTHRLIYERYKRLKPGSLDTNPYMSVSSYADVAVAVANSYRNESLDPVYLFRIELERSEIIRLGTDFPNPWRIRIAKMLGLNTIVEFVDGSKNTYVFDERVESFVYMRVPASKIVGVFKIAQNVAPVFQPGLRKAESRSVDGTSFLSKLDPVNLE